MKKPNPGLVKRGLARKYRGKYRLTGKGRERLKALEREYDRVPPQAVKEFVSALALQGKGLGRRMENMSAKNIAVSGDRISLEFIGINGKRKSIVVKRAFFPHTVTKRQLYFMRALRAAFEKLLKEGTIKPKTYSFKPVRHLGASARHIVTRYYPKPSVGDIVYEMDRKKLLEILGKRQPAGLKFIKGNVRHSVLEKRLKAIIDMGRLGTKEAKQELLNVLENNPSQLSRGFACFALAMTGDGAVREALNGKRLTDSSPFVRWRAALSLYMLEGIRNGKKAKELLPADIGASLFLSHNQGITYTSLRKLFSELKEGFETAKPLAEKNVRKRGYKRLHLDVDNLGNVLVHSFNGKKFVIGLIDIG